MHATLRIVHQRANLQQVRLCPVTVIGRSADCHLKIASAQVSRRHCQLVIRPDGVYLEDLGSANGTILDGVRVPQKTPTYVQAGAQLEIGPARFVVDYDIAGSSTKLSGPETQTLMRTVSTSAPEPANLTAPMTAAAPESLTFTEPPPSAPTPRRSFFGFLRRRNSTTATTELAASGVAAPEIVEDELAATSGEQSAAAETNDGLSAEQSGVETIEIATTECGDAAPANAQAEEPSDPFQQFLRQL